LFSKAIASIWRQQYFDDATIYITKVDGKDIYIEISVTERSRLGSFFFKGIKKSEEDDLKEKIGLSPNKVITENLRRTSVEKIEKFYIENEKSLKTTIPFFKFSEFDYNKITSSLGLDHQYTWIFYVLIVIFIITAVSNGANITDGIDGLAASIGTMACIIFGFIFFRTDQINYAVLCAATTGSLVSFFVYNVYGKKNKIFMGDTGSLILGLILCVSAIEYNESTIGGNEVLFRLSPVLSLSILAVPLFDMVRIFSIRILHGKSPFSPDMNHIHHKFLKLGLTHMKSTSIIILSNLFISFPRFSIVLSVELPSMITYSMLL